MKKWIFSLKAVLLSLMFLISTGCGQQPNLPEVPGVKGPIFNLMDGQVLITMKLLRSDLNLGARVPIPKTKASYFEITPNLEDGGSLVVFYLDVEDLRDMNIGVGDGNTLPDGRPIPGVPGGVLQGSLRADVEALDMSFYFHQKLFGFFIPIRWDTNGLAGSWNIIIDEKNIGTLGVVASDREGNGAGVMLFLRLDQLKNRELQQMIEHSKRNPKKLF
jgi:hypothetical protein